MTIYYHPSNKLPIARGCNFKVDGGMDAREANLMAGAENVRSAHEDMVAFNGVLNHRNHNLSEPEKELMRWHAKLGHMGLDRIQFLMRSQVLSHSEETRRLHQACGRIKTLPKCAACQFGKTNKQQQNRILPSSHHQCAATEQETLTTTSSSTRVDHPFSSTTLFAK